MPKKETINEALHFKATMERNITYRNNHVST